MTPNTEKKLAKFLGMRYRTSSRQFRLCSRCLNIEGYPIVWCQKCGGRYRTVKEPRFTYGQWILAAVKQEEKEKRARIFADMCNMSLIWREDGTRVPKKTIDRRVSKIFTLAEGTK